MLKDYVKITWRNILRHKGYSFINMLGLALGMAVCILILLWVQDELSFDRFHSNSDQIYRVVQDQIQSNGDIFQIAVTPWPLGGALLHDYPDVVNFTRYYHISRKLITSKSKSGDKSFYENNVYLVDPSFLKIFSFPLLKGDSATALSGVNSVVITEKMAEKYFGTENPIGKTLTFSNRNDFIVTGVLKNIPHNSHLQFDFLLSFEEILRNISHRGSWNVNNYYTFLLLQKNASPEILGKQVYNYYLMREPNSPIRYRLQALNDMHLHSNYAVDLYGVSKDSSLSLYIFTLIAFFILLIACINFVNLTIARFSTRAREVGLRKVVGARRKDLIAQFFGESILLTTISLFFAIILVYLLLPLFNDIAGKELTLNPFNNSVAGPALLLIALITGIIAGVYPAIIQSSFQPANIIKGNFSFGSGKMRSLRFGKVLVIFQFTCSVALIICTLVVSKQLIYMQNKDLGYDRNNIIYFTRMGELTSKYDTFKEELLKNLNISSITTSSSEITYSDSAAAGCEWEGKDPNTRLLFYQSTVDYDYFKTFKMKILEGREFSKEFTTDAASTAYILNESAVKAMDLKNPVGKMFSLWGNKGTIIGVVRDFHYKSLHNMVEPLVLRIDPSQDWYIYVKLRPENITATLNYIKQVYQQFNPSYPFEYQFLDDQIDSLYDNDRRALKTFQYFTFIAIFISCLGLFGLATFTAQKRTKEIGIRKVVGASVPGIIRLLSKEILILVLTAIILAWPIAYFGINKWLQTFAYRTTISVGVFVFSSLLTLTIAICTIIYQSVKAATANPVDAIKYE